MDPRLENLSRQTRREIEELNKPGNQAYDAGLFTALDETVWNSIEDWLDFTFGLNKSK